MGINPYDQRYMTSADQQYINLAGVIQQQALLAARLRASSYPCLGVEPKYPLSARRATRWEHQMVRMKEKLWERRRRTVGNAVYWLAMLWGSLFAVVFTIWMIQGTIQQVLG